MERINIITEELMLAEKFGLKWEGYKQHVRRWNQALIEESWQKKWFKAHMSLF